MKPWNQYSDNGLPLPSVSGGKDNPPDRYSFIELSGNPKDNLSEINRLAEQGYRFAGVLPIGSFNYVLMGNYKENK